jgi:predicted nucleotide-binding protein (sugar kinase/HSP70/actin superfamily)
MKEFKSSIELIADSVIKKYKSKKNKTKVVPLLGVHYLIYKHSPEIYVELEKELRKRGYTVEKPLC